MNTLGNLELNAILQKDDKLETRKYIYKHTSPETAYIVNNYPWGFRLKTTIRYWIETKTRKNCGQRFARQTINPKTGNWCAPKYSTYSPIIVLYLNEDDHIKYDSCSLNSDVERLSKFKEDHWLNLDDYQKDALREIFAYNKVMESVTWTFTPSESGPVDVLSKDPKEIAKVEQLIKEQDERKKEKALNLKNINKAIAYQAHLNKTLIN